MATSVSGSFNVGCNLIAAAAVGPFTQQLPVSLASLINEAYTNGNNAAGAVSQLYYGQGTLAASAAVDVDLYAFGGAKDGGGNAYTQTKVKLVVIRNFGVSGAVVEADYIAVGGKGTTAGWTSFFGTNTDTGKIYSGRSGTGAPTTTPGFFIIGDSGAAGYAVGASTTNHLLTLTAGSNTGTVAYDIIVVGTIS